MEVTVTLDELERGISLPTGERHKIRLTLPSLRVRLNVDPNVPASRDDRFILEGFTSEGRTVFEEEKTVVDDQVPGDQYVDLVFERLRPASSYDLRIDPGAEGEPYYAFRGMTWGDVQGALFYE